ncbi:MAG: ribosome biogenesis GTPase Der [Brevinema sp.]
MKSVVIVGRPNTGKSTLFNFLVSERKSIVDPTEGVTRDIVSSTSRHKGYAQFYVWDTAGYLESTDVLDKLAQEKIRYAVSRADLVLLTVDAQNPHPLDQELALLLKKQKAANVIVVANKADNRTLAAAAAEFYSLGFEQIVPVSAIQKTGLFTLIETIEDTLHISAADEDSMVAAEETRFVIVGRPNAGKSLLFNTLLGYERMIVSDIAGTTRDAADEVFLYKGRKIRLTDTAGFKRNAKIKDDIEYYAAVRSAQAIEHAEVAVLLLDAAASIEEIAHKDKTIAQMISEKKRGMVFALNKWDLLRPEGDDGKANQELMKAMEKKIRFALPEFEHVPLCFISAKDDYKTDKLLEAVIKVRDDFHHKVATGTLNNWLAQNLLEYDTERAASRLKIYYGSQVYTAPPRFVFFINKKAWLKKDFPRFLEKRLRLAFEFTGVPMTLTFRERGEERPGHPSRNYEVEQEHSPADKKNEHKQNFKDNHRGKNS